MQPLVSIITPSYNKQQFILETINSVINQTYQNWELILVDDMSSDETIIVAKQFSEKDNRIKIFVNEKNKGANYCRNFGLKQAQGEYVIFLDADDLLGKTCLENRVKKAQENSDKNLWVFAMGVFKKEIGDDNSKWQPTSRQPLQDFLQHKLPWSILQPLWKRSFLVELNGFDETFERLQDVELHTRALLHSSIKWYQFSEIMDCYYRIDEERKNFNSYQFLKRWINSSVLYCNKFEKIVSSSDKKYLFGTVLKTYFQLIYNYRLLKITQQQFEELKQKLLSCELCKELSATKKMLFNAFYFYHSKCPRVPGINFLFEKLIVL